MDKSNQMRLAVLQALSALCQESGSFHHDRCPLGVTVSSVQMEQWHAHGPDAPGSPFSLPPIAGRQAVPQRAAVKVQRASGERSMVSKTFEVRGIAALVDLPRLQLGAVLAHELCHAFMHLFRFPRLPPVVTEGVCELWAWLWLSASAAAEGGEEAAARLRLLERNADPVYGAGLRQAKACFDEFMAAPGDGGPRTLPEFMKLVRRKRRWWVAEPAAPAGGGRHGAGARRRGRKR